MKTTKPILGKWNYIFLLGESGGGKDTLLDNIIMHWLPSLSFKSMDDVFREKAELNPEIRTLTESGVLIGDDITFKLFKEEADRTAPGLIAGFPLNRRQALDAIRFVKSRHWRALVIDILCDIDVIIKRLLGRGREGDRLAIMHKRNQAHKMFHPAVMEEIKNRFDLFDVISLNGNLSADITFTNFTLEVLRLSDMTHFYDEKFDPPRFMVNKDETTINPAVSRFICDILCRIHERTQGIPM